MIHIWSYSTLATHTLRYRPPDVLLGSTNYSDNIDMWWVGAHDQVWLINFLPETELQYITHFTFKGTAYFAKI